MNAPKLPKDPLFRVELRIARRADELARLYGTDPVHALDPWRQAEREMFGILAATARHFRRVRI